MLNRCEFDITLTINSAGTDNQSCEQSAELSFKGTQTVSSDFPTICGSIEKQPVTISWDLHDFIEPSEDGSTVKLIRDLRYLLDATVSTWGIELFPEENEQGVQIEYPGLLFSLQLTEDLRISGGDAELYTGTLQKTE